MFSFKVKYEDAIRFMEQRRYYAPPVYNIRRIMEIPLPNIEEIDVDAELQIHNEIECGNINDVGDQNVMAENRDEEANGLENMADGNDQIVHDEFVVESDAEIAVEYVVDNENANLVENSQSPFNATETSFENAFTDEIDIEHIKIEGAKLVVFTDEESRNLANLLLDETDPLKETTGNPSEPTHNEFGESAAAINQSLRHSENNLGVASCSYTSQTMSANYSDQGNNVGDTVAVLVDEDVFFVEDDQLSDNYRFPMPMEEPGYDLVKREADRISGDLAFRITVCVLVYKYICIYIYARYVHCTLYSTVFH